MSFNSTTRIAGPFLGDGVNKVFGFGFKVFANGDVLVELKDALGDVSEQVLTTDYLVTLNDDQNVNPGGFITMTVAPAGGSIPETVTLSSKVAETQPLVLRNQSAYYPRNIEDALDRNAILSQQLANKLGRAITIPLSDGEAVGLQLPTKENRANKGMKFDADGNVVVTVGDPDDVANQVAQAEAARDAAEAARDAAEGHRDDAGDAAALAESWAVDPIGTRPEGSAKHWAEASQVFATDADDAANLAYEWANNPEDTPVSGGEFSAKHWAVQAQLIATTSDYITFGPAALTANQAVGVDPIVLPVDPKIAARVTFNLGGVMQIAGTDFALDAAPDTVNLRIVGGSLALTGVVYSGVVQLPSSLTNINAPSAGSVVETTIQNGAVNLSTKVSGKLPVANIANGVTGQQLNMGASNPEWGYTCVRYLQTQVAANSASIDFTNLDFTTHDYILTIDGYGPAAGSGYMAIRTSTNNGSSFDSTSGNYNSGISDGGQSGGSASDTFGKLSYNQMVNTETANSAELTMSQPAGKNMTWRGIGYIFYNTGLATVSLVSGNRVSNTAVNAIRIYHTTGNITTGTFVLYSRRRV